MRKIYLFTLFHHKLLYKNNLNQEKININIIKYNLSFYQKKHAGWFSNNNEL